MKPAAVLSLACAVVSLSLAGTGAVAQDASKYFTVMHPEKFDIDWKAFYAQGEARTAQARATLPHYLDQAYGSNPKQKLDLYLPATKPAKAPVLLFLHGGGFREGDRAQYGFIATPFAKRGIIVAVASYRLSGDGFKYPDQPEDAHLAMQWLYRNVAKYGGDPQRLYISGHSAGAILSADLGVDRSWLTKAGIPKTALRGFVPVSGRFDLRVGGIAGEGDVYVPTPELQEKASALLNVKDPAPAAVIAVGSKEDPKSFVGNSEVLSKKLKASGTKTEYLLMQGADHKDTALALADENSPLFKAVIAMIEGGSTS